eukprot:985834-Rhodomonas_salina.2
MGTVCIPDSAALVSTVLGFCVGDSKRLSSTLARHVTRRAYTPKSNTRDRIPGTNCTEFAVSCIGFWGVGLGR